MSISLTSARTALDAQADSSRQLAETISTMLSHNSNPNLGRALVAARASNARLLAEIAVLDEILHRAQAEDEALQAREHAHEDWMLSGLRRQHMAAQPR